MRKKNQTIQMPLKAIHLVQGYSDPGSWGRSQEAKGTKVER